MIDANKHIENKTKNAQTNLDAFGEKKKKTPNLDAGKDSQWHLNPIIYKAQIPHA